MYATFIVLVGSVHQISHRFTAPQVVQVRLQSAKIVSKNALGMVSTGSHYHVPNMAVHRSFLPIMMTPQLSFSIAGLLSIRYDESDCRLANSCNIVMCISRIRYKVFTLILVMSKRRKVHFDDQG